LVAVFSTTTFLTADNFGSYTIKTTWTFGTGSTVEIFRILSIGAVLATDNEGVSSGIAAIAVLKRKEFMEL
jgi:hypothetical protein